MYYYIINLYIFIVNGGRELFAAKSINGTKKACKPCVKQGALHADFSLLLRDIARFRRFLFLNAVENADCAVNDEQYADDDEHNVKYNPLANYEEHAYRDSCNCNDKGDKCKLAALKHLDKV